MLQPYQRQLLRALNQESPFTDFYNTQFELPKFLKMNTSFTSRFFFPANYSNPSNVSESSLPEGARFLTEREKARLEAEQDLPNGRLRDILNPGRWDAETTRFNMNHFFGSSRFVTYCTSAPLHPQDVLLPAGFRLVGRHEVCAEGDHYVTRSFLDSGGDAVYTCLGMTAEKACDYFGSNVIAIARPVSSASPVQAPDELAEPTKKPKPVEKNPVDMAIDELQALSAKLRGAPTPRDVKEAMTKLVATVEEPLRAELLDARDGCKQLNDTVLRQRDTISSLEADKANLETAVAGTNKALADTKAQLHAAQRNARGNAVLLRRDGFSKPMEIAPSYAPFGSGYGGELPRYLKCFDMPEPSYQVSHNAYDKAIFHTLEFMNTGRKDGFGRTIFEQC